MDFNSISAIQNVSDIFKNSNAGAVQGSTENTLPFSSVLTDAIDDVKSTGDNLTEEAYKVATGETDNLHDVTIASTKYSLAVDLFVQIRNKTLDSYNQIMNMNV